MTVNDIVEGSVAGLNYAAILAIFLVIWSRRDDGKLQRGDLALRFNRMLIGAASPWAWFATLLAMVLVAYTLLLVFSVLSMPETNALYLLAP